MSFFLQLIFCFIQLNSFSFPFLFYYSLQYDNFHLIIFFLIQLFIFYILIISAFAQNFELFLRLQSSFILHIFCSLLIVLIFILKLEFFLHQLSGSSFVSSALQQFVTFQKILFSPFLIFWSCLQIIWHSLLLISFSFLLASYLLMIYEFVLLLIFFFFLPLSFSIHFHLISFIILSIIYWFIINLNVLLIFYLIHLLQIQIQIITFSPSI